MSYETTDEILSRWNEPTTDGGLEALIGSARKEAGDTRATASPEPPDAMDSRSSSKVDAGNPSGVIPGMDDVEYADQDKDELQRQVDQRNAERTDDEQIVVKGTGKDGRVLKSDLIDALEADDEDEDEEDDD